MNYYDDINANANANAKVFLINVRELRLVFSHLKLAKVVDCNATNISYEEFPKINSNFLRIIIILIFA